MTTILIACGVALAATVLAAGLFLLGRRSGGVSEARLQAVVAQVDARLQALVGDLSDALERAQEENRRTRLLAGLGGTIDLDEVIARTLEAAEGLEGVDAAVLSLASGGDEPLVSSRGLGSDEPAAAITGPPDGAATRSIAVEYEYAAGADGPARLRAGLAVPVASDGERLGHLAVYSRGSREAFGPAGRGELEAIALLAGPALGNALRFRDARRLADLDALTGLHNRRYFHETLAREVARAHRYGRSLALVVFDVDDFKAINDRIGHLAGDAVLAEAAERIREVVRSADVACRVGGDEFAVILPESSLQDADELYRRLEHAVSAQPVGLAGRLHLSAGVTEVRRDDDEVSFFERADDALYRAKGAGKGTVVAVDAPRSLPRRAPGTASSS